MEDTVARAYRDANVMPDSAPNQDDPRRRQLEELLPRVLGWALLRLRGRPEADAEDLAQEVLCRALVKLDRFREGNLTAWVFRIAHHVLLESLRRYRRNARVRSSSGGSSAAVEFAEFRAHITTLTRKVRQGEEVGILLAFAEELDEIDHKLVLLCGLEGTPPREVATQLGLGEDAIVKRWYRLRARLRKQFGGEA